MYSYRQINWNSNRRLWARFFFSTIDPFWGKKLWIGEDFFGSFPQFAEKNFGIRKHIFSYIKYQCIITHVCVKKMIVRNVYSKKLFEIDLITTWALKLTKSFTSLISLFSIAHHIRERLKSIFVVFTFRFQIWNDLFLNKLRQYTWFY